MKFKTLNHIKNNLTYLTICFALLLPLPSSAQTQVSFAWQPNTEPDIAGYRLFSRTEGEAYSYNEPAWEGTETSCAIDIPGQDVPYFFVLRAFDTEGFESIDSDEVCYGCTPDINDNCPDDPEKFDPGVCGCGVPDIDSDNDGILDCDDNCPDNPDKTSPGICGCGTLDIDSDQDDILDCFDGCIDDPDKSEPGICGCGITDIDTDRDGFSDCIDSCPADSDKVDPGICGCGQTDTDTDEDGLWDCYDMDDDNDGIDDDAEANSPNQGDANRDGILDAFQCNVCSIKIDENSNYVSIESSEGTCISNFNNMGTLPSVELPQDIDFIYGQYEYTIRNIGFGNSVIVTITLPQGASPDTYYTYGRTPDNPIAHWYDFLDNGKTGAVINKNIITLYFIDAMKGDNILSEDSMVMSMGGPGLNFTGAEKANNPVGDSITDAGNDTQGNSGCFVGCLPK